MDEYNWYFRTRLVAFLLVTASLACSPLTSLLSAAPDQGEPSEELVVDQTRLSILESFPVQVQLNISGQLPNSCTQISTIQSQRTDNTFHVFIETQQYQADCSQGPVSFEEQVELDVYGLPAGEYAVEVGGVSQRFTLSVDNSLIPEETPSQSLSVIGQGVRLYIPAAVGGEAQAVLVEEQNNGDSAMPFLNYPDKIKVNFPAYPLRDTFHIGRVELYPLQATISLNQAAAGSIDELRNLLETPSADLTEPLPFLPIFNAGPMIQAQEKMLSSSSVEGVRYLTQYGQAQYPINNSDLFYTFQGITTDQSHYILAILPVNHPGLPATADDYLGQDPLEFYEQAESHFAEMRLFFDEQPANAFIPDLASLDAMLISIQVE